MKIVHRLGYNVTQEIIVLIKGPLTISIIFPLKEDGENKLIKPSTTQNRAQLKIGFRELHKKNKCKNKTENG